jgi:hypothetical protein
MKKMRVSNHNARVGKNGVFSPKHNDRNFNLEPEHIDENKSKNNYYWMIYDECKSFEECEKEFYKNKFLFSLESINEKHIKSRHKERIKTMDDYRTSPKTCPEETLYYIGDKSNTVDTNVLQEIILKQIEWESEQFPDVVYLNIAIHRDEEGADHIHARKVYIAPDEDGFPIVNQTKALANMGIERPDTSKPSSKFNNAKMTYTKLVREHFIELCKEYGLEIETEPKEKSKTGYSLEEYKLNDAKSKLEEITEKQRLYQKKLDNQEETFLNKTDKKEKEFQALQDKLEAQDRANKDLQSSLDAREERLNARESDLIKKDRELQVKQKECDTKQSEALQTKKKYDSLTELREKDLKAVQNKLKALEEAKSRLEEKEKSITELYNTMESLYKDMQVAKENDSLENWARNNTTTVRKNVNGELKPVKITILEKYEMDKRRQSVGAERKIPSRFDDITNQYDNRWHTPNLNDYQT